MTPEPGEIPATPAAQAELMFKLARALAESADRNVTPEGLALMAHAIGVVAAEVHNLKAELPRADQAYARGLRDGKAAAEAAAPMAEPTDLPGAIAEACARFDAMTPAEQAAHRQAQRESFVQGMGPCEHGVRDFEQCPQCRDEAKVSEES